MNRGAEPRLTSPSASVLESSAMNLYESKQLADGMRVVRKNTIAIAEDIPETQDDYRPTPDSRSVRETLLHIHEEQGATRWRASISQGSSPGCQPTKNSRSPRKKSWTRYAESLLLRIGRASCNAIFEVLQALEKAPVCCRRTSFPQKPGVETRYYIAALSFAPLCDSFLAKYAS
jgi:hypothetical protein